MTEENIKTWDPMKKDYQDAGFNTYTEGPGAAMDVHLQPAISGYQNQQQAVKLHVTRLPDGITAEGVRNLFLNVGQPQSIYLHPSGQFAIVDFSSYSEAELAIRDLDSEPPYRLKISFSKSKSGQSGSSHSGRSISNAGHSNVDHSKAAPLPIASLSQPVPVKFNGVSHGCWLRSIKNELKGTAVNFPHKIEEGCYQYLNGDINDTVKMWQTNVDFKSETTSISAGRGYLYMGEEDRFVGDRRIFSVCSQNWKDDKNFANIWEEEESDYILPKMLQKWEAKFKTRRSVVNSLSTKTTSYLQITSASGAVVFGFLAPAYDAEARECIELYLGHSKSTDHGESVNAEVGDAVLVLNNREAARRGIVLSKSESGYTINLVDYARVVTVPKVYNLPEKASRLVDIGVKVALVKETTAGSLAAAVEKGDPLEVTVKQALGAGKWNCFLRDVDTQEFIAEAIITKWAPPKTLNCVPLDCDCVVVVSHFMSLDTIYVRRVDDPWQTIFSKLDYEVAKCALMANPVESHLEIGEMYAARFDNDGGFYRGVVMTVDGEKVKVAYVDFGNEAIIQKKDLRPLPGALTDVPCFACKVNLLGVPKRTSRSAVEILTDFTAFGEFFIVSYKERSTDGVTLTEVASKATLNRRLTDSMVPLWKTDGTMLRKSGNVLYAKNFKFVSIPVGPNQDVAILHFDETQLLESGAFWATDFRLEIVDHVYGELLDRIAEYCDDSHFHDCGYLPRVSELCLAQFEGEWLRGVCIGTENTICNILFVDFGTISLVPTSCIRKMIREFIELPGMAMPCVINGYERIKDDLEQRKKVMQCMRTLVKTRQEVEIVKIEDDNTYVTIPQIETLLKK